MTDLAADLRDAGAAVRLAGPVSGSAMPWPAAAPEVVAPVLAIVRAQHFALALARQPGRDPDQPAGPRKVTVT